MEPGACEATLNCHTLDEFGPYHKADEAQQTLLNALKTIGSQGGGVLYIPRDAPTDFIPRDLSQQPLDPRTLATMGVTVVDYREGIGRTYVPPLGSINSMETAFAGSLLERDLAQNLPRQGLYSAQNIVTRHLGGASSYDQRLTRATKQNDQTLYVPTCRGLFAGQKLWVTAQPAYGSGEEVTVKSFGTAVKQDPLLGTVLQDYLVVEQPTAMDHPAGALIYNKNVADGLSIQDISNCDNQSYGLQYDKTVYGIGDSFIFSGSLNYQGDIMSGGGDEGGVGAAVVLNHDLDCFWGHVESWQKDTGELIYQPGATAPQKIGTSRPIINMNEKKWIHSTDADPKNRIFVERPNTDSVVLKVGNVNPNFSQIVARKQDVPWDASIVGRFIAIDEPGEYYAQNEMLANGSTNPHDVHRWWHITALTERPGYDGATYYVLSVEITWFGTTGHGGPILFLNANYCDKGPDDLHPILKPLKYIIAPGAWISDAREGIAGLTPGSFGIAALGESRKLVLAPAPSFGTTVDFETCDPITNPPGPNVWRPVGFRVRHWDNYPGYAQTGISYLAENYSKVQLAAGLTINAPAAPTLDQAQRYQKDQRSSFGSGVAITAPTDYALNISGDVPERLPSGNPGAAILLHQTNVASQTNVKAIQWTYKGGGAFARLYVDPETGNLVFVGGQIDCHQAGMVNTQGLSATATPACNLSGVNVPVPAGASQIAIKFATREPDPAYGVLVECNWITAKAVTAKTIDGFTVLFDKDRPPPSGATLDWFVVRGAVKT